MSSDGVTAEILRELDESNLEALAAALNLLFLHSELPQSWSEITATLVPKLAVPSGPKDFRPIAALVTLRKLVGYLFLYFTPSPSWQAFQCGFVSGRDAAQAVFCVKRLGEVAKEWKQRLYIAQLDMSKAFDKVYHSAILTALDKIHAGPQLKAFIANMLRQSFVSVNLGNVRTEKVRLDRGLPQGAPESPFLFILVTEMALASLHDSWAERGLGYLIDGCWLPEVAYADDVVLLAMSIAALQTMLLEVEQAFAAVGLTLNVGKTNFTSTLACEGSTLELSGHVLKWSPRLTFLGTVITLCGNDDEAIRARMTRALRAFQKLVPIAHKQNNCGGCTCGCFSHLGHVVFLPAGPELDTHKETIQLHWQLVCASWLIHDQSQKMPRGTHGFVVETSPQRRQEILDKTPRRCNQHG